MAYAIRILLLVFFLITNSTTTYAHHTPPFRTDGWYAVDKRIDYNWRLEFTERETKRLFSVSLLEFGDEVTLTITTSCELEPLRAEDEETTEEIEDEVKIITLRSSRPEIVFSGCSHVWVVPDYDRPLLRTIKAGVLAGEPNPTVLNLLSRLSWWNSVD